MSASDTLDNMLDMFLDEAGLMLDEFEQTLLAMANASHDAETLNAAFRAAHNIKGTAGMFGFERVVAFTHEVETVLDRMRSGTQALHDSALQLLIACLDQIKRLLQELSHPDQVQDNARRSEQLIGQLQALQHEPQASARTAPPIAAPADTEWLLGVRFGPDSFRDGYDPASFLSYLGEIGEILELLALTDEVPLLDQLDPERCQLGFLLRLRTKANRDTLESAFAFVADSCVLRLQPAPFEIEALRTHFSPLQADADQLDRLLRDVGISNAGPAAGDQQAGSGGDDDLERLFESLQKTHAAAPAAAPPAPPTPATPPAMAPARAGTAAVAATPAKDAPATTKPRPKKAARESRGEESRHIRVAADKLDNLIAQIGELVIAVSSAQIVAQQHNVAEFSEIVQRLDQLVEGARDHSLRLRMVPVGDTFTRFKRIVFDVCRTLGKEADLVITGGETELDKSMVEQLMDPLTHLVRNALDHGLELPEERVALGKPPKGQLQLNAYHDAGAIVIEVTDDGRGLARERILAKAIERGLVAPDATLSDEQIWNLVFLPGFSTAEQVTDLSGRGVGMDVVRRNIEALRGEIQLASRPGAGSTVRIRLPLTLAIIDGFLVEVAGASFVLPLDGVEECLEVPDNTRHQTSTSSYFELRDSVVPLLCLRRHLRLDGPESRRRSVVMVRHGGQRVGLLVDRLHGEHQTVIKPLGRLFSQLRCISGSTIFGSGSVALILDIPALLADAVAMHAPATAKTASTAHSS